MPNVHLSNPTELHNPTAYGYSHLSTLPEAGLVFISGQYGSDQTGAVVSADFADQVEQAFANLGTALAEQGLSYRNVARLGTYIVEHDDGKLRTLLHTIAGIWGDHPPAQTLIGVAALALPDMDFEVDAIAVRP